MDIEGEATNVLSRMGVLDTVREKSLPTRGFERKDVDDGTAGTFGEGTGSDDVPYEKYEIHRDDLLKILFSQIEPSVEVVFGRSIKSLDEGLDAVAVTFSVGSRRDLKWEFGCDGLVLERLFIPRRSNSKLLHNSRRDWLHSRQRCRLFGIYTVRLPATSSVQRHRSLSRRRLWVLRPVTCRPPLKR